MAGEPTAGREYGYDRLQAQVRSAQEGQGRDELAVVPVVRVLALAA